MENESQRAPKVRYVDFYADEWLAGTHELSVEDRGLYITICALIWSRGDDIGYELLKRHSNAHGNALNAGLIRLEKAEKIVRNGSEISQKRARNELEKARKRVEKASENGAKGGRPNGLAKPDGSGSSKANYQLPTTNHQPIKDILSPNGERSATPQRKQGISNGGSRGTRLPVDWQPNESARQFAAGLGLDVEWVIAEFCDYWKAASGPKASKCDWNAAFRTWCRRERKNPALTTRQRPGGNGSLRASIVDAVNRAVDPREKTLLG